MKLDDMAADTELLMRELALRQAKTNRSTFDSKTNTHCLWCQEKLDFNRAYCDDDCAADHRRYQKRR